MKPEIINDVSNDDGLSFQYARWYWANSEPTEGYCSTLRYEDDV